MKEILDFMFLGFWHFIGCLILFAICFRIIIILFAICFRIINKIGYEILHPINKCLKKKENNNN